MKKMKRIAAMTAALLICSGNMGYMPEGTLKIGGFAASAAGVAVAESVEINKTNFPDAVFHEYVAACFDTDKNGILSAEEISAVTTIDVPDKGISDLTGIEHFTALETLSCQNNQLTSLDVSNNTVLWHLNCSNNKLITLDVSNNTALESLFCDLNQLTSLDLSNNTVLWHLDCYNNQLTSLDVSKNTALEILACSNNQLTSLDVSKNTALEMLACSNNQLTSLDVSKNTALEFLSCTGNQLTSLDASNCTSLKELDCYENQLTSLDVSNNTALESLNCTGNQLTSLDVSNNAKLNTFYCDDNTYKIPLTDGKFDLSTLPTGFDIRKASDWTNGTVEGNILTVEDDTKAITYKYNCGYGETRITFSLITENYVAPLALGDANGDSAIDSSDATLILSDYADIAVGKASSFTDDQAKAADVNGDGKYDSIDASLILAYYSHIQTGGTGTLEEFLNA